MNGHHKCAHTRFSFIIIIIIICLFVILYLFIRSGIVILFAPTVLYLDQNAFTI